jgi:hypothetical protein
MIQDENAHNNSLEFKPWPEIKNISKGLFCRITEKIHGSNAQILITEDLQVLAGSRTRFLYPGKETDNYGFAQWVQDNKQELIEKLGVGTHYGEWCGSGINGGYGLKERRLALFNVRAFPPERPRPEGVDVVPVLYEGAYSDESLKSVMESLKVSGSKLYPGCMFVEGVVVDFPELGRKVKVVFEAEETGWKKASKKGPRNHVVKIDTSQYLQPIRLEKLLSRDSRYVESYPENLPDLCRDYMADMEKEGQLEGVDEVTVKAIKSALYGFIKSVINKIDKVA